MARVRKKRVVEVYQDNTVNWYKISGMTKGSNPPFFVAQALCLRAN